MFIFEKSSETCSCVPQPVLGDDIILVSLMVRVASPFSGSCTGVVLIGCSAGRLWILTGPLTLGCMPPVAK